MSARDTAKASRHAAAELESREFVRALHETGVSQADVAVALGRAHSRVSRWAKSEFRELPNTADIACFPPALREWYARRDAERAGLLVSAAPDVAPGGHLRMLASVSKETGELVAMMASALADGRHTVDELRKLQSEGGEALEAVMQLLNTVKAEIKSKAVA